MLKTARVISAVRRLSSEFDVEITGIATAVPRNELNQVDAAPRQATLP